MPIEKKNSSHSEKDSQAKHSVHWMSYEVFRSLRRKALAILAGIAILLSVFGLLVDARQPHPPVFVSVSIKTLLDEHLRSIANSDAKNSVETSQNTTRFLNAIDSVVEDLTAQGDVIVLISEAVMGSGVPDFTDDIRKKVNEKLEADKPISTTSVEAGNPDTSSIAGNLVDSSQGISK